MLCFIDSVLEPLVPKEEKMEDFVDIKAGDLLINSESYKYSSKDRIIA